MYTLVFSIAWTVLMTLAAIFHSVEPEYRQYEQLSKIIFTLAPLAGLLFVWDSARKLRRTRSVQRSIVDGQTIYSWTELDGSQSQSTEDPRVQWDKEDRYFADP